MPSIREQIEQKMLTAFAGITPAAYEVPRPIRKVTREHLTIDQVAERDRPTIVLLTDEDEMSFLELGPLMEGSLRFTSWLYETIRSGENAATILNQYTAALQDTIRANLFWDGLAEWTDLSGAPQHQLLHVPDVMAAVAGVVHYLEE